MVPKKITYTLTPSLVLKEGLESIFLMRAMQDPDKSEAELALDRSSSSLLELSAPPMLASGLWPAPKEEEVVLLGPLDDELMSLAEVTLVELVELLMEVR